MTTLALVWYALFWASLGNWSRFFGRPDLGTAAVHLATAPLAALVALAMLLRLHRAEYPRD